MLLVSLFTLAMAATPVPAAKIVTIPAKAPVTAPVVQAPPAPVPKCYTIQDVRDEGCKALCLRDNYAGGRSSEKGCICEDVKENYEDYTYRRMSLGSNEITEEEKKAGMVAKFRPNAEGKLHVSTSGSKATGSTNNSSYNYLLNYSPSYDPYGDDE